MSAEYYEDMFQKDSCVNTIYMKMGDHNKDVVQNDLKKFDNFIAFTDKATGIEVFEGIATSIDSIIRLLIFLSAVLALVVVMDLAAMYIKEKERILAIMRINGFTLKETKRYIAKNNSIIVAIGLIAGVLLGILLGYFIVQAIENDTTCFVHTPNIKACVLGMCLSGAFAIIVNWIASRRIDHLPLNQVSALD
jgi:putative ABC transport system permease protein